MRAVSIFAIGLAVVAAAPARDWSAAVAPNAAGAWVIGNPAARVKLTEWASYTCPHCAHFDVESRAVLKGRMIRSGSTSLEVRHLIRDPLDLAAVAVARCGGPRGFVARHHAIFDGQERWLQTGAAYLQKEGAALAKLAQPVAFRRIADAAGLTAIGKTAGLTDPQVAACFAAPALDALTRLGQAPAEVQATPSFFINGRYVPNAGWAELEPVLRQAGAR
jgi:protein-disulfide isomerase